MFGVKELHLDDFTLLRYVARDLEPTEREPAEEHLRQCGSCSDTLGEIRRLERELRLLAREALGQELPPDDPFRSRPPAAHRRGIWSLDPEKLAARALADSERGGAQSARILEAARASSDELKSTLSELSFSDAADRYALLYALQEAGREIAESPVRWLALAEEALNRLRRDRSSSDSAVAAEAEIVLPLLTLFGQAHLLAGQACVWIGEYEKAQAHLRVAYRAFGRGAGDEVSLAMVEYQESQRRSFIGRGNEALLLARRAAETFESLGLEDYFARARASQGLALSMLGREEEALEAFRGAQPLFENRRLWSNYVAAVNSIGECLVKLGRLDEARREHARALRRVSREQHPALVPHIRDGLATALFSAGRYRQAALSFSQALRRFQSLGLVANALRAALFEIESWALCGDIARASHRLEIFRKEVQRHSQLDPSLKRQIAEALSGENPDFRKVAELRQHVGEMLKESLRKEVG